MALENFGAKAKSPEPINAITTRRQPNPGHGLPPAAGTNDTTVRVWLSGIPVVAAGA